MRSYLTQRWLPIVDVRKLNRFLTCFLLLIVGWLPIIVSAQQFLVQPYIQPGNVSKLINEEKVLIWQTDATKGDFTVEYTEGEFSPASKILSAKINSNLLNLNNSPSIIYRASLKKLKFDVVYAYRLRLGDKVIFSNGFLSRTKKPDVKFVVFGDCGASTKQQLSIVNQIIKLNPQFALITGDIVYSYGLEREYRKNFFPYYNAPTGSSDISKPLMASIPFYSVLGNHDTYGADLKKYPDGLAYFYYYDLPINAPLTETAIKVEGDDDKIKIYKSSTSPRFPKMANYSFDYGNVHVVCLDANSYVNPLDPNLVQWLRLDLGNSKADWKIVTFHHPGFNGSKTHYDDQQMRLIAPLLEQLDVDLVLSGHVHNYQRSLPLKFAPKMNENKTLYLVSKEGKVDGEFTLDKTYDGVINTKPDGIIYIVTGAGGAVLYDSEISDNPELWKKDTPENWTPFTAKLISNKHSFTTIETSKSKLTLKQLDENGEMLDQILITK